MLITFFFVLIFTVTQNTRILSWMEPRSVLVSYTLDSSKNPFSCSGTLISENWVLAHGSLLEPFVSFSDNLKSVTDDLRVGVFMKNNEITKSPEFSVSWEVRRNQNGPKPPCCGAKVIPNVNNSSDEDCSIGKSTTFEIRKARLAAAWKCPLLVDVFEGILSSWRFSEAPLQDNVAVADKELFPLFLLLKIEEDVNMRSNISKPIDALKCLTKILAIPQRGQDVEIESTPFGNPVFMNSVTNGIVSNILGPSRSLLLTDANAVIGCEGGPIFIRHKSGRRSVCGIVIAPLSWCRGEWVGYTLGVSLLPCLHRVFNPLDENNNLTLPISGSRIVDLLDKSVVVVRCGSGWGSGVLLDKGRGIFLTCSHVVREAPNRRITIGNPNFSTRGELVYKTPGEKSYDLAIVRVDPQDVLSLQDLRIRNTPIHKRDEVVCAGYPLISSREEPLMFPTITRGEVSHVSVGMLQTSCCIQSGTSGGPVVSYPGCELVGIVVCNATSAGRKALFPRINMAVPSNVFEGPIREYLRTQDVISLNKLENRDTMIQRTWNLNLTPLSHL